MHKHGYRLHIRGYLLSTTYVDTCMHILIHTLTAQDHTLLLPPLPAHAPCPVLALRGPSQPTASAPLSAYLSCGLRSAHARQRAAAGRGGGKRRQARQTQ